MLIDETRVQTLYQAKITVQIWAETPDSAVAQTKNLAAHISRDKDVDDIWIGDGVICPNTRDPEPHNAVAVQHDSADD